MTESDALKQDERKWGQGPRVRRRVERPSQIKGDEREDAMFSSIPPSEPSISFAATAYPGSNNASAGLQAQSCPCASIPSRLRCLTEIVQCSVGHWIHLACPSWIESPA